MKLSDAPFPHLHYTEIDSTSAELKRLLAAQPLAPWTTLTADYQTQGRGQQGNSWEAEDGANLLFSWVCYPQFLPIKEQFLLSEAIALGLLEGLTPYTDGLSIKWPNDLYWQHRKLAGILIEHEWGSGHLARTLVGIGLNVNQTRFVSNAPNPVSLAQISGATYSREEVLTSVMTAIQRRIGQLEAGDWASITQAYRATLYRAEGYHLYQDKEGCFSARFIDVEPTGTLWLEDESGRRRAYLFKEISYVLS